MKLKLLLIISMLTVLYCSCNNDTVDKSAEELSNLETFIAENYPNATETESGLYIVWTENGTGNQIKTGDYVNVKYTGKYLDGTVFDASSYHSGTFQFQVGAGSVIAAWDEAMQLCKAGDKITIISPSSLAYGIYGSGSIAGYTSLVFDIEIIEILK